MNIKSITVEFTPTPGNEFEPNLASRAVFEKGTWIMNGPMKSSYLKMLHELWSVARTVIREDNKTNK